MKAIPLPPVTPIKVSEFLLLGIAADLIAIHLTITWKSGFINLWGNSVLFWVAVCSLTWRKHHELSLKSGKIPSFIGALLITGVLLKSTSPFGNFLLLSPFISVLGLSLIASGFRGLKQYWQQLLVLSFLGVPQVTLLWMVDISAFTARFAAFVLWYLGLKVSFQGVHVTLPTGGVEVYPGCSGIENITYMSGLAVLFLVMFPTHWSQKILVPVVAIVIGFVVNGVRIALMTYLIASDNLKAFAYWHTGDGSLIFSMVAVLIFGLFCLLLLQLDAPGNEDSLES